MENTDEGRKRGESKTKRESGAIFSLSSMTYGWVGLRDLTATTNLNLEKER